MTASWSTRRRLKPFRWWQLTLRSLLSIELPAGAGTAEGSTVVYAVEVLHLGDLKTGEVMASLYRDGRRTAIATVPALFPVPGGRIDVRTSEAGLRRAHFIAADGSEHPLEPHPRSAEGRRLRFARRHPAASRAVGAFSIVAILAGSAVNLLQVAEAVSGIPPIATTLGRFDSPIVLPLWLNISLALAAAAGAMERAMRLRYHWLLDSGGGG